jgi:type I restriction enzyme M protein
MAIKKSELYRSLWRSCDELRGGMDASQYKDYVLTLLFMKYVSDKYAGKRDAVIEVPAGGSFADMVQLKGDKEIGDKMNKVVGALAKANSPDLDFLVNATDFNDEDKLGRGKEMQDRLAKLVAIFDGLDLRANRAEGDDLLGDAYEYLMRHFATESGKSKGQFYTPAEVSRIMAQVVGIGPQTTSSDTIYDPTCGSGSLLLKAADEAPHGISIYGQEMDNATWVLARMNMFLHDCPTHEIWRGNTLASPHFKNSDDTLKTFDFAVANPPFSSKAWSNGLNPFNDEFDRFEYGVPPIKNGDYAFLLHLIKSLKSKGKGAIILPHGVLFRANKEGDIRRNLIQRGLIKGIIGLPANLFYGTGIPACVVVVDKENAHARSGIFIIDASRGFVKDGNKNRLRAQDSHKIVDVFNRQLELPRYSRMVPVSEIESPTNDYNLNIPRYIDSSEPEDLHDLDAHLNGGIPNRDLDALDAYWKVFPSLRKVLFKRNSRKGYSEPRVQPTLVKATILAQEEFKDYAGTVTDIFRKWRKAHEPLLKKLRINDIPRQVIHILAEDLLKRFGQVPLLSRYDVYQRLMDYWFEVMQDDIYLVAADGWIESAQPRAVIDDKERKIKEMPDLTIGRAKYKMDLIPPVLIVARYFAKEQAAIDDAQVKLDESSRMLEEFVEENTGEDGLLEDAMNDKGKVTRVGVNARLKEIGDDPEFAEECKALEVCSNLLNTEVLLRTVVNDLQEKLDRQVLAKYFILTEAEIKTLVVDEKWFASIQTAIESEVQRLTQQLASRVRELEERYAKALPELERDLEEFGRKVKGHLKKMGLVWG